MVLYLIGLGLGDEQDITLRGLQAVRKCKRIFLEAYTAVLMDAYQTSKPVGAEEDGSELTGIARLKKRMAELYHCEPEDIIEADRTMVEQKSDVILKDADKIDVAFLVVGDALAATTHADLMLRAHEQNIPVRVIYNASIMNACAACGLQLYTFGQSVSIVLFEEDWRPDSFYDRIKSNRDSGLHTLCLLDIKVKEQSKKHLSEDLEVYEPPRFMTVKQCIQQLLEVEDRRQEGAYSEDTQAFGLARVGQDSELIVSGRLKDLLNVDFGPPLHSVVICAPKLHEVEQRMVDLRWFDPVEAAERAEQRVAAEQEAMEKAAQSQREESRRRREAAERRMAEIRERKAEEQQQRLAALRSRRSDPGQEKEEEESESSEAESVDPSVYDDFLEFM